MLGSLEPTVTPHGLRLYPCEVVTDEGEMHSRVYLVEATAYIREWGVWPWADPGKRWMPAERIRAVRSSPARLPARFANTLLAAGESGMGYHAFAVDLRDGRRLYFISGNAVDFLCWPEGLGPDDVVAVHPGQRLPEGEYRQPQPGNCNAEYAWAPFRLS